MVSFFGHLNFWNEPINFKIVDFIINPIDFFLIFCDNTFHRLFLAFRNFDSHYLEITWAIDFIIDFTYKLFVADHRSKTLFMDRVATIESFHHLVSTCPAFEALLLRKDFITDYSQFSDLLRSIILL